MAVYQNDQRKVIQRWLNSCTTKRKDINEEAAGLEGSTTEYEKVQVFVKGFLKYVTGIYFVGDFLSLKMSHEVPNVAFAV